MSEMNETLGKMFNKAKEGMGKAADPIKGAAGKGKKEESKEESKAETADGKNAVADLLKKGIKNPEEIQKKTGLSINEITGIIKKLAK